MSALHPTVKAVLKPSSLQWFALVLLVISVCINYADRGNLGVAATHIETDLRLDPQRIGDLSTAFFWTYALFQLIAGKLIDRWNVNWVYAAGFLVWSGATGATGLVNSFWAIFFLRLLLGAGESIAYPAYSKIIAMFFPERLRGTANAMIDAGSKIGPALGVMAGVEMLKWFSWRGMFIVIGATSLVWLLPWCIVSAKLPSRKLERASAWAPTYLELMRQRPFWGTVIGLFCGNYTWYFYLSWLPYYFEKARHYRKDELAVMASLPFWAVALSSMLFGLVADALIRRGREPGLVRQSFMCIGLLGCCGFMFSAVLVSAPLLSDCLLVMAAVSMGLWSSNHWAFTQRLSGAAAAGKWTAFQNCIGAFAGVIGSWVTGHVLGWTHSFFAAFAIACVVLLFGVAGYWFVVGAPREILWGPMLRTEDKTAYIGEVP
jgi:MFS transporter, ACS family, D-galactonate transporter